MTQEDTKDFSKKYIYSQSLLFKVSNQSLFFKVFKQTQSTEQYNQLMSSPNSD